MSNGVQLNGTVTQILAWAMDYDIDITTLQGMFQQIQLGFHEAMMYNSIEPQYVSMKLEILEDHRMLDLYEAMTMLDPSPKLLVKQAALRAIAIASQNDEKHEHSDRLNLLNAFFLMA